ncbi:hypothetical protein [Nocardiopsis sp. CC223A]|uniref:hypothetical protein n=1 Tax=Nocardiopsis sp. CC223A TaxID=3044051 RepID=UPI00278C8804|nr:hypothetical protein [Nocardiopsis sp. CC223A]
MVRVVLGRCHRAADPVTVRAEETEDTVTLHGTYLSSRDSCLAEDVRTVAVEVELAEPLGNREVQDTYGESID